MQHKVKRFFRGMVSSTSHRIVFLLVCLLARLHSYGVSGDCVAAINHSYQMNCGTPDGCYSNWTALTISDDTFDTLAPSFFKSCSNLVELLFMNTEMKELKGERLRGLSALNFLTLSEVPVYSLSPAVLSRVPSLTHFTVTRGNVRELAAESFKPCAEVQRISFDKTPVAHLRPFVFSDCEITLKMLTIRSGRINWFPATAFSRLTSLRLLDLTDNRLTSLGPRLFSDLSDLRSLVLKKNFIRSIDVNAFQGLTALTKLDLSNNRITEFKAATILHMPYLQRIKLDNNRILKMDPVSQWPDRKLVVMLRNNRLKCQLQSNSKKLRFSGLSRDLPFCSDKTTTAVIPTVKQTIKQPKSQRYTEKRENKVDDLSSTKSNGRQFILVTPSWLLVWAIIMTVAFAVVVCILVFVFLNKRKIKRRRRGDDAVQEEPLSDQATL